MTECPPSLLSPKMIARIARVNAGEGLRRRFYDLGLIPDAEVTVISTDRGSLIVSVAGCRYALSRYMAMKIHVAPKVIIV